MRKIIIIIIMLMIFVVGMLPLSLADNDDNENQGKKVKAGIPIVFSTGNDNSDDNNEDDSDSIDDTSDGSGGGDRVGSADRKRIVTAQQTSAQNAGLGQMIRSTIKAKVNVSELMQNLSEQQKKVFSNLLRAQQKRILQMNNTANALNALNKYKLNTINKSMQFRNRVISAEKIKNAAKNYGLAVSAYAKYNSIYKDKAVLFHDAKERLKPCVGDETDECNQLRDQAQEHAKDYLKNGANMVIEHLNKLKSKIEGSEEVDDKKAEKMIEDIENSIDELKNAVAQVGAAQTKDEIKDASKVIYNIWNRFKNRERVYTAQLYKSGVWNIIKRSEQVENRLDKILDEMEEKDLNIIGIDEKVDEFSEKVQEAKDKYQEAEDLLEENGENVDQARQLLSEAHQTLKDAHRLLVDIVNDIKEAGGEITEETEEEELYEVVEDEEEE